MREENDLSWKIKELRECLDLTHNMIFKDLRVSRLEDDALMDFLWENAHELHRCSFMGKKALENLPYVRMNPVSSTAPVSEEPT